MRRGKQMMPFWAAVLLLPLLFFSGCHDAHDAPPVYPGTLIITNSAFSGDDIWYAYATPSSSSSWGEDLLGGETLYPGDSLVLDVYECDRYYDVRVDYAYGTVVEEYGVWVPCDAMTEVIFNDGGY